MRGNGRRAPKRWTEAEDKILWEETRKQTKAGNVKDWNRIAARLPNRSNKDCRKRWVNTLSGSLKKGAWDEDEDERLITAVNTHGQRWTLVATVVGFRSPDQCAKRWQHNLDPKLEHKGWTQEEDELLLASVKKYGREWKLIQEQSYTTRSRNDLKNRYSILSRRRSSASTHGARQNIADSPSTTTSSGVSTPGKGPEEDMDLGIVADGALMQDLEVIDGGQGLAYVWGDGTFDDNWLNPADLGPDSILDPITPKTAFSSGFSQTEGTVLGDADNIDPLFGFTDHATEYSTWVDSETGGESLYDDLALDLNTPCSAEIDAYNGTQSQVSPTQADDTVGENSTRRVSLVVDQCDWITLRYLLDMAKPLKDKVKLEMNV